MSSLLDTFALLFETDAGDAADDVDRLGDSLDATGDAGDNAARGVDATNAAAADATETMGSLVKGLAGVVAGYLSWQAISASVFSQAVQTDEVGKFSETLGIVIEDLDAWSEANIRNGGSADAFRGSVDALNEKLGDLALTGGGDAVEVFGRLGISALDASGKVRKVTDIMLDLAGRFEHLNKQESTALGKRLGLDQGTILMLQQGRVAVEQMVEQQRQLGGRTQEGYAAAALFNDTLADTQRMFVGVADSGNQKILPVLTAILKGVQTVVAWMQDHEDVVTGFFIAAAFVITTMYLPAITAAAAATLAAALPFILIGGAIAAVGAAFALLYEDVKAYIGGQESYVGSLAEKYEWFGNLLDGIINGALFLFAEFSNFADEMAGNVERRIESLGGAFKTIFGLMGGDMEDFNTIALSVVDAVIAAFKLMGTVISEVLNFIASPIETTSAAMKQLKGWADSIDFGGWFSDDEAEQLLRQANVALSVSSQANMNPLVVSPGVAGGASSSYINQTNHFSTKVDARGMDRDQATQVFGQNLREQVAAAQGTIDDGVAY